MSEYPRPIAEPLRPRIHIDVAIAESDREHTSAIDYAIGDSMRTDEFEGKDAVMTVEETADGLGYTWVRIVHETGPILLPEAHHLADVRQQVLVNKLTQQGLFAAVSTYSRDIPETF